VSESPGSADLEGLEEFRQGDTHLVFRKTGRPVSAVEAIPSEIRHMLRWYGTLAGGITVELLRT
jgi:hypothetical protein